MFNEAMDLGIRGYVLEESAADVICESIRLAAAGYYAISPLTSQFADTAPRSGPRLIQFTYFSDQP